MEITQAAMVSLPSRQSLLPVSSPSSPAWLGHSECVDVFPSSVPLGSNGCDEMIALECFTLYLWLWDTFKLLNVPKGWYILSQILQRLSGGGRSWNLHRL